MSRGDAAQEDWQFYGTLLSAFPSANRTVVSKGFYFSEFGDPTKSCKAGHSKAMNGVYALFRDCMDGGAMVLLLTDPRNLTEQSI